MLLQQGAEVFRASTETKSQVITPHGPTADGLCSACFDDKKALLRKPGAFLPLPKPPHPSIRTPVKIRAAG